MCVCVRYRWGIPTATHVNCVYVSPIHHHTHFPLLACSKIEWCVNMTSPTHKHTHTLSSKHTHYDAIVSWFLVQNVCVCYHEL